MAGMATLSMDEHSSGRADFLMGCALNADGGVNGCAIALAEMSTWAGAATALVGRAEGHAVGWRAARRTAGAKR